ncbi:hypothetical protein FE257_007159 [Aspergillus nanangensis]|uniref:Uncharacterized protein n=1 Tax=Aspergillus nanangensis TaxID=2582783 RepID=A0AAD4CNB7_ASPNN|nr:hypothetical protein FE257_007159 [Aspergillus nanangensis]
MACVNFWRKRSLRVRDDARTGAAELTPRQSLFPITLVAALFFLWGFSYGLLDTLNKHFQTTLGIDKSRSAGLQAAYFGARRTACIPAIKAKSFGGFRGCTFVIGNGLGSLETAANSYITLCGPPKYSEIRINISQAFNAIGTVVAPVLGSYVFFVFDNKTALQNVQWVYTAIAIFAFTLAGIFFLSDILEITDADMAFQTAMTGTEQNDLPFRKQDRLFHASFAQFCYTGAQVALAGYFINYVTEIRDNTNSALGSQLLAGARGKFAIGRLLGASFMKIVKPPIVLVTYLTFCIVFYAPAITQRGDIGVAVMYLTI